MQFLSSTFERIGQLFPAGDVGKKWINIKLAIIKLESKFLSSFQNENESLV